MISISHNRVPGEPLVPPPLRERMYRRPPGLSKEQRRRNTAAQPKCGCGSCLSLQRVEDGIDYCPACERQRYSKPEPSYGDQDFIREVNELVNGEGAPYPWSLEDLRDQIEAIVKERSL